MSALTVEELAAMRNRHEERQYVECGMCIEDWPCDASRLLDEVARLRATVERVRELHRPSGFADFEGRAYCTNGCIDGHGNTETHPCDTIRALDGTDETPAVESPPTEPDRTSTCEHMEHDIDPDDGAERIGWLSFGLGLGGKWEPCSAVTDETTVTT